MRTTLQGLNGRKAGFTAVFWAYGTFRRGGTTGKTILLRDLLGLDGHPLADHTWINYTAGFDAAGTFRQGDIVQFTATVGEYVRGYLGPRIEDRLARPLRTDYRLKYPRNVRRIGTIDIREVPA
ncbi:hypothetical protein [Methanofollis fontis]|uniref:Uncharacterized protein n=1 Tax=Methanofollis fontis TaxID=2052832 RepID=A0A483CPM7_9EURY|nr:hypothetical protein [Methanofollis fontis]TAJ44058.1 hypothetical protein CUJ86_08460 [Methanofollis fontis]